MSKKIKNKNKDEKFKADRGKVKEPDKDSPFTWKVNNSGFGEGNNLWQLRENPGRERVYKTADDLWTAIVSYFQWACDNPTVIEKAMNVGGTVEYVKEVKPRPMTNAALCVHLGICVATWHEYGKSDDYGFIVKQAKAIMFDNKFTGAAAGTMNASLISRELGLVDNVNVEQKVEAKVKVKTEAKPVDVFAQILYDYNPGK